MSKIHFFSNLALIGLFTFTTSLIAADEAPPAPIPAQILSAKRVFIANANDDCTAVRVIASICTPTLFYNEFYAAMKNWGRFDLTSSPADADLIFELRFDSIWLPMGDGNVGMTDSRYKLLILDPKTRTPLWSLVAVPELAARTSTAIKNYGLARAQIVNNLKVLIAQTQNPKTN